jgi:3-deoxy-D-manno-octulosonate 8-phosphate phosphatase (KDO 8-P phosphatase)
LAELRVPADRAAVIGDDLPDLPLLRNCGFPVAVADAVSEVKKAADYVTAAPGGGGAVRETIERILKGAGRWNQVLQRYQNRKLP